MRLFHERSCNVTCQGEKRRSTFRSHSPAVMNSQRRKDGALPLLCFVQYFGSEVRTRKILSRSHMRKELPVSRFRRVHFGL